MGAGAPLNAGNTLTQPDLKTLPTIVTHSTRSPSLPPATPAASIPGGGIILERRQRTFESRASLHDLPGWRRAGRYPYLIHVYTVRD